MKTQRRKREKQLRVLWEKIWAPSAMFLDPYLTHLDTRIGGIFAACQKRGVVVIGQRRLAKMCRASLRDVSASIKRLALRGYVTISPLAETGKRNTYYLLDPMYGLPEFTGEVSEPKWPGLFCACCQNPMRGALCIDCQGRQALADAI